MNRFRGRVGQPSRGSGNGADSITETPPEMSENSFAGKPTTETWSEPVKEDLRLNLNDGDLVG